MRRDDRTPNDAHKLSTACKQHSTRHHAQLGTWPVVLQHDSRLTSSTVLSTTTTSNQRSTRIPKNARNSPRTRRSPLYQTQRTRHQAPHQPIRRINAHSITHPRSVAQTHHDSIARPIIHVDVALPATTNMHTNHAASEAPTQPTVRTRTQPSQQCNRNHSGQITHKLRYSDAHRDALPRG